MWFPKGKTAMEDNQNPGNAQKATVEEEAAHLKALLDCSRDLTWSVDLDYRLITFNRAFSESILANWGVAVKPGMTPSELAPACRSSRWPDAYKRALTEGSYSSEYMLLNGRWLELSFKPVMLDGTTVGVSVFAEDITEEKLAENRIMTSEARLRSYFELQLMGMAVTSPENGFLEVNDRACEILGHSREELLNLGWSQITHGDDLKANLVLFERMAAGEIDRFSLEKRFVRKDGSSIWTMVSVGCVRKADGSIDHVCSMLEDISERKAAEGGLQKAEQEFRAIFEQAPEGIFKTLPSGQALSLNPSGARMLGYGSSQEALSSIKNLAYDVWVTAEERAAYVVELEEQGEIHDRPTQFKRNDGSVIWVAMTARRVCGAEGQPAYYQGYFENLSEKMRLESELNRHLREVKLLSEMNGALLRARSEKDLLEAYCRIIVETGGYRMAWVGFAQTEPEKRVVPVAWYGHEDGFLSEIKVMWDGSARSKGLTGRAIISGEIQAAQDFDTDRDLLVFHEEAARRGFKSSIAVPFHLSPDSMACLSAYGATKSTWSEAERKLMDQVASALGFGINTLRTGIAKAKSERALRVSLEQTIQVIAGTVDQRDPYTAGHQRRVADLCMHIARKMGLPEDRVHGLRLAASIHDLGKVGIPAEILSKPGPLTAIQYSLVKEHAQMGYDIVRSVRFPWPIAEMVLQHHERMDGSGYPNGLVGDQILLESRILAVGDVVEVMATHRPYRASLGVEAALEEISRGRGKVFDADAVDACLRVFREDGYTLPGVNGSTSVDGLISH
jgi:PAS domain S-box-containing protein